jgi:hypothetical protein
MSDGGKTLVTRLISQNILQGFFIALSLTFGILYVFQMNEASMKAYTIRDLENNRENLTRESDRLLAEVDRLRSLKSISEREAFLGMVEPVAVKYLKIPSSEVALGK